MNRVLSLMFLVLVTFNTSANTPPTIKPVFKKVLLTEFTSLSLDVFPDVGTQLVFPFKLDNPELSPSLKIHLTSNNGFEVPTTSDEIAGLLIGQNTITITGKVNTTDLTAKYISYLFINIGGYNLSISLKNTHDPKKHISNIIFKIDKKERLHMIENYIKKYTDGLDKKYKNKLDSLDDLAKEQALSKVARLAMNSPSNTRFKEEADIKIGTAKIELYIDNMFTYENEYNVLFMELKNRNNSDFVIEGFDIILINDGRNTSITGAHVCNGELLSDSTVRCSFATTNLDIKDADKIKILVRTNRGQGEYEW